MTKQYIWKEQRGPRLAAWVEGLEQEFKTRVFISYEEEGAVTAHSRDDEDNETWLATARAYQGWVSPLSSAMSDDWAYVVPCVEIEPSTVVVTRHQALVEYLQELGLVHCCSKVLSHATEDDVRGKHVIGVVPLSLAVVAEKVTVIPLDLAPEDRGKELTLERLREIAGPPTTYVVGQL